MPAHLSAHTSLSIPALGAFQLHLTPFNSTPTFAPVRAEGIAAAGARCVDLGLMTTPQLHYVVYAANRGMPCGEEDYFERLAGAFKTLASSSTATAGDEDADDRTEIETETVFVDCANGVGAAKLRTLASLLGPEMLPLSLRNVGGEVRSPYTGSHTTASAW